LPMARRSVHSRISPDRDLHPELPPNLGRADRLSETVNRLGILTPYRRPIFTPL